MERFAMVILNIVHSFESIQRHDMIPSPFILRTDPVLSDALDYLIDNGYVEVAWTGLDPLTSGNLDLLRCAFNPAMESIFITSDGFEALIRERAIFGGHRQASPDQAPDLPY